MPVTFVSPFVLSSVPEIVVLNPSPYDSCFSRLCMPFMVEQNKKRKATYCWYIHFDCCDVVRFVSIMIIFLTHFPKSHPIDFLNFLDLSNFTCTGFSTATFRRYVSTLANRSSQDHKFPESPSGCADSGHVEGGVYFSVRFSPFFASTQLKGYGDAQKRLPSSFHLNSFYLRDQRIQKGRVSSGIYGNMPEENLTDLHDCFFSFDKPAGLIRD